MGVFEVGAVGFFLFRILLSCKPNIRWDLKGRGREEGLYIYMFEIGTNFNFYFIFFVSYGKRVDISERIAS